MMVQGQVEATETARSGKPFGTDSEVQTVSSMEL
jgi:hypothetical protein